MVSMALLKMNYMVIAPKRFMENAFD